METGKRIAKKYTLTHEDLLNDRWCWGIAWKFNKTYQLRLTQQEIYSEIACVYVEMYTRIKRKKVKITLDDYTQTLKYFRYSVRSHFCDIAYVKKKKGWREIPTDPAKVIGIYNKSIPLKYFNDKVIRTATQKTIYRFILNINKTTKPSTRIKKIYEKFGKSGIDLILKCRWAVDIKKRRNKMAEENIILSKEEMSWMDHCMKEKLKAAEKRTPDAFAKDVILKYAMKQDSAFWRRVIRWIKNGMQIDHKKSCFSHRHDDDELICQSCVIAPECKKAMKLRLIEEGEEYIPSEPKTSKKLSKESLEQARTVGLNLRDATTVPVSPSSIGGVVENRGSYFVTNTKPRIYISSIKKEPYSCSGSAIFSEYLKENKIEFKIYKDETYGFKLTAAQVLELVEKYKIPETEK